METPNDADSSHALPVSASRSSARRISIGGQRSTGVVETSHRSMRSVVHLVRRFVWSLQSHEPSADDLAWVDKWLSAEERVVWNRFGGSDRVHSITVARRVAAAEESPETWLVAAALLHDIGKVTVELGTIGRAFVSGMEIIGLKRVVAHCARWSGRFGDLGRYLDYPARGAALLHGTAADPRVTAWASEHHDERDDWSIPPHLGDVLVRADNG